MIQKIRNLDPVYYVLYCIFIVFLKYVYFVFANPGLCLCLACAFRIGTWFPCSLAASMSVVFPRSVLFPRRSRWSSLFLVTVDQHMS